MNVRYYMYTYFRQAKIAKRSATRVKIGAHRRPNTSSFSSPILLVRKTIVLPKKHSAFKISQAKLKTSVNDSIDIMD